MLKLDLSPDMLRPIVAAVVVEVLDQRGGDKARIPAERLAEAATMLGVQRHVLRDARRRGELSGSREGGR